MRNSKLLFLLGISLLSFKGFSQIKKVEKNVNITENRKSLSEKLSNYMQAQADVNGFSGTVLIVRKDSVLLREAYGYANYEWKIKTTADTKFSLASVSKQFTAVAILQLAERKLLSVDDTLNKYFPGFPKGDQITLHMMLSHMSGLAMDFDELYLNQVSLTQDNVLSYIAHKELLFTPGKQAEYSNIGYYLLARIIEKVSGKSYSIYLKENIFDPLKMNDTGVMTNEEVIANMADRYIKKERSYNKNPYINWSFNIGHDGVYSTADDLSKWDRALYGVAILSEKMRQIMFTSYNEQNFGYGFLINPFYRQGHQLIAHDGGFFGAMTSLNRFTDDDLLVIVLSNNQSPAYMFAYGLAAICFGKDVELPYYHQKVKNNVSLYKLFKGNYEDVKILENNGKLYYNDFDIELFPESDNKFFRSDDDNRTLEFIRDSNGKYSSIKLTKAGVVEIRKKRFRYPMP
ncbi:serine hydrolase domain-containing protein [Chryseobacterium sp. 3008163]|uniref:serine hydrolase domain-containing protein n=1 Tax=Chryseobacterium sp. 3008163 TaxID=2478663 RepID=UPI000F0C43CF|nr:serine hydrolase domain-containing protein [Chryseobacterium sp. 3008163]AYM99612.1 class A beta-lactamase-related serine hydrolase [Chryseobacterium sp. 3008163]